MVLGSTMRALPLEDFEKAQKGSRVSAAQANAVAVMNLVQKGFLGMSPDMKLRAGR